jgi:hypothetical protein
MLCGCPTILLPNDHFKKVLGQKELLGLGYAWGTAPEEIAHAKKTVHQVRERYLDLLEITQMNISLFIKSSQELVSSMSYNTRFAKNELRKPSCLQKFECLIYFLLDNVRDKGLTATFRTICKRISSNRLKLF